MHFLILHLAGGSNELAAHRESQRRLADSIPGTYLERIRDPLQYIVRRYLDPEPRYIGHLGQIDVYYYDGQFYDANALPTYSHYEHSIMKSFVPIENPDEVSKLQAKWRHLYHKGWNYLVCMIVG